jgi:membrane protein required for colicin V production
VVVSAFVRNLGGLVEKTAEDVMLGPLNRMAGFVVFALSYMMLYSIVLYYVDRLGLIRAEVRDGSSTFAMVSEWGPAAIGTLGKLIPFLGDVFQELQRFFDGITVKGEIKHQI